jgi:ABC-type Mn2+/Zn2+ transport system permease subunit
MGLAVLIGIAGSLLGLYLSYWLDAASGATIVLVETAAFLAALAVGPRTGLLARRRPATA